MGPDEYHDGYPGRDEPGLDNNAYTNVMAAWVLCRALETLELLPDHRRAELTERLGLAREELDRWDEVSRKLRVCFHDGDIISQFEGYGDLEELDWDGLRRRHGNIRRLDRILEAEGDSTNRYKASKQADVLMLFYLLSAEELRGLLDRLGYRLEPDAIRRNVDYYLERTSHGSTLSGVVNAWVLARSDRPQSWRYFTEALASDLHDVQGGTTAEGIHLGAMAGTVDLAQRCYTGLEAREDVLWLNPSLPEELDGLDFDVRYRGHWGINLHLTPQRLRVRVARLRRRSDQGRRQRRGRRAPTGQHARVPALTSRTISFRMIPAIAAEAGGGRCWRGSCSPWTHPSMPARRSPPPSSWPASAAEPCAYSMSARFTTRFRQRSSVTAQRPGARRRRRRRTPAGRRDLRGCGPADRQRLTGQHLLQEARRGQPRQQARGGGAAGTPATHHRPGCTGSWCRWTAPRTRPGPWSRPCAGSPARASRS